MEPISKIEMISFNTGTNLNPFDIYIILPDEDEKELEAKKIILDIWDKLTFLPAIFNLILLRENNISDGEEKVLHISQKKNYNIFARVLGISDSPCCLEFGNINTYTDNQDELLVELLLFILQLCQTDLSKISDFKRFTTFRQDVLKNGEEKLIYLEKIEKNFLQIQDYLKTKLKNKFLNRIQDHNKATFYSQESLRFVSLPLLNNFKTSHKEIIDLNELIRKIGIKAPIRNTEIDPEIEIEIKEEVDHSIFPGIIIKKGGNEATVTAGFREGIFLYTCALLYHMENKEFRKKDFEYFLIDLFKFQEGEFLRVKDMSSSLRQNYNWYEDVYDALFKREEIINHYVETYYKGRLSFEEWIIELLNKLEKVGNSMRFPSNADPLRQGISRVRRKIRDVLKEKSLEEISIKVDLDSTLGVKDKPYKLYVDKDNLIFPNNERWDKIVKDKKHLKNRDLNNIISE